MATLPKPSCKQSTKTTSYRSTLDGKSSERYTEKLNLIQIDMCPFDIPVTDWKDSVKLWPPTEFPDLCMYLLDTPGVFTKEKLKTYKSLEAYNYFNSGYVRTCMYFSVNTNFCVIKASVNPSQRSSDNPHEAWVAISKKDGGIVTGHCKCMAGLGETCSHVAAILFKIEAANRLGYTRDACTSEPCVWNQTFNKKVNPEAIVKIDFKKPKRGKTPTTPTTPRKVPTGKHEPSTEEFGNFLKELNDLSNVVNVLSTVPEYCEQFQQQPEVNPNLPTLLRNITIEGPRESMEDVRNAYQVTREECDFLEKSTTQQSASKLWSVHREGRITASIIHSVVHTNQDRPSKTVMEAIFREGNKHSKCTATEWGVTHEEVARNSYSHHQKSVHKNFQCHPAGLVVNPDIPHIAASPDGWVSCDCCGKGVIEVKCPYKYRDVDPADFSAVSEKDKSFCLEFSNQQIRLKKEHQYHLQVQTQMYVADVNYCDFIVWTRKGFIVVCVQKNTDLMQRVCTTVDNFFLKHCLPKLCGVSTTSPTDKTSTGVSKLTTVRKKSLTVLQAKDQNKLYCLCQSPDDGSERMIACDGDNCRIEWFHFRCIRLKRTPRGQWFCSQCRG